MNIFDDAGLLIIGTRLKRLSDRFLNEVSRVYKNQDIRFEPVWFPIFYLLDKKGSLSLTEIATEMDVSHSAVSQMITQLLNKKMVEIQQDTNDGRIKKIVFSPKGKKLIEQVHPVWEALQKSLSQLLPADLAPDSFLNIVAQLEVKLSNNFLSETTLSYIQEHSPEIEFLEPDSVFRKKLESWIKSENVESDRISGSLLVALHGNVIKGYVDYELKDGLLAISYIYVTPFYRRKGIALKMLEYLLKQNSSPCFLIKDANLDLIKVLIKSGYSFKVN